MLCLFHHALLQQYCTNMKYHARPIQLAFQGHRKIHHIYLKKSKWSCSNKGLADHLEPIGTLWTDRNYITDDDAGVYHVTKRQTVFRHISRIMCIIIHIGWKHSWFNKGRCKVFKTVSLFKSHIYHIHHMRRLQMKKTFWNHFSTHK